MARLRTHPGEVLREEYLVPLGLSARALARELDVPANRLTEILRGTRDVSADTAIRLGRYFGTDPRFWLNLQAAYDLSKAEKAHSYKKIVPRTALIARTKRSAIRGLFSATSRQNKPRPRLTPPVRPRPGA
jgi:addiction module HigA family antidote